MHLCAHSYFNHFQTSKYTIRKNCVDTRARDCKGAIEICLSEKWALAKKWLGNTVLPWCYHQTSTNIYKVLPWRI